MLVAEVLRRSSPSTAPLRWVGAVDPIGESALLRAYAAFLRARGVAFRFFRARSSDAGFQASLVNARPALIFIDGARHGCSKAPPSDRGAHAV